MVGIRANLLKMTNPNEIPEIKGAEFARARERVGMSTADLAKMASLTQVMSNKLRMVSQAVFIRPPLSL